MGTVQNTMQPTTFAAQKSDARPFDHAPAPQRVVGDLEAIRLRYEEEFGGEIDLSALPDDDDQMSE
jgi:hypothetical protein